MREEPDPLRIGGVCGRAERSAITTLQRDWSKRKAMPICEKMSGENPFLAYGVVNHRQVLWERRGDGAYMPPHE